MFNIAALKKRIYVFLKSHWVAIFLALTVGVLMVLPQFLFRIQAGETYQGFDMAGADAEYHYLARIKEVYNGHYKISSLLAEGKDFPYSVLPLGENIMGVAGRVLHLGIGDVMMLFRFVGPVLLFFLIYFLVFSITSGHKKSAILAPIVIILASNLISEPQELWQMINGSFSRVSFLIYARPVNPQISSLFLFGFLYSFWKLDLKTQLNKKRYLYYCILLFGLSFYVYPFTWSFLLVFLFIYTAILLIKKEKSQAKRGILILLAGLIIAIPYFINVCELISHQSYQVLKDIQGMHESREFIFSKLLLIIFFILLFLKSQRGQKFFWYFFALGLTGFIVINQQVITGQKIWPGHYHYYIIKPLAIIIGVVFLMFIFRRLSFVKKKLIYTLLVIIIIFVSFFNAFYIQIYTYPRLFNRYLEAQRYGPVIEWLNKNGRKDEVAYATGSFKYSLGSLQILNDFIMVYTPLNVYYSNYALYYLIPYDNYRFHNLFITLKLLGITPDEAGEYLANNLDIFEFVYGNYFRVRGLTFEDIPPLKINQIIEDYRKFCLKSWYQIFTKYPINYIVWDKSLEPNLLFDEVAAGKNVVEVYNEGGIIVYKFLVHLR